MSTDDSGSEGVRVVTWKQFRIGVFAVFFANAMFTVVAILLTKNAGPSSTFQQVNVNTQEQADQALRGQLSKEYIHNVRH